MNIFKTRKNILALFILAILFVAINVISIRRGYGAAKSLYPLINDTWYRVLTIVKEKTPEQTIINSWWDFGDWFKVIGRRRVIFDGQSQDSPQAYWMAKAILSHSEEGAVRILRMLNNGGNKAFEIINEHLTDPLEAVLLLEGVMMLEREEAEEVLGEFIPEEAVLRVIPILFNHPARACFIVEHTMIRKMPAISYLGNWDFSKVYIAQNFDKQEKEYITEHLKKLGRDKDRVQQFYQEVFLISTKKIDDWLSHRLQFYSDVADGEEKNGMVIFKNGFVYDPEKSLIRSNSGQIPRSLFAYRGTEYVETVYPNANAVFSALVFKKDEKDGGGWKCILLDRALGASMFTRLYFFKGRGLRHFFSFIDVEEGNNYIRVYNIAW